jgi:hypothetical protein
MQADAEKQKQLQKVKLLKKKQEGNKTDWL